MNDLQHMARAVFITKLLTDIPKHGHFSICTVTELCKELHIVPHGPSYDILHKLHCVDYKDMPPALLLQIPQLMRDCLGCSETSTIDFNALFPRPSDRGLQPPRATQEPAAEKPWYRRLLST